MFILLYFTIFFIIFNVFLVVVFNSCFTFMYAPRHQVKFLVRVNLPVSDSAMPTYGFGLFHQVCARERLDLYFYILFFAGGDLSRRWVCWVCLWECECVYAQERARAGQVQMPRQVRAVCRVMDVSFWGGTQRWMRGNMETRWCSHCSVVLSHQMTGCYCWP